MTSSSYLFKLFAAMLFAGLPCLVVAQAQYPTRAVKLVMPSPAGTGPDLLARSLAVSLASSLNQPVVVENKAGANGNIAGDFVAKAAPDGYTLMVSPDALMTINPHVYAKLAFNPLTDFLPVGTMGSQELFLCVSPSLPVKNLKELIDYAKQSAAPLNYGSASSGSQSHLAMEMLKIRAGINLQHVPYKGGGAAAVAAVSGEVVAVFGGTSLKALIQSGKLRAIASTGVKRSLILPDLPTVAETLPGFESLLWVGLFAPAGTPPDVMATLRSALQKYTSAPDATEKLALLGFEPFVTTADGFRDLIKKDAAKYAQVIKAAGVKLD